MAIISVGDKLTHCTGTGTQNDPWTIYDIDGFIEINSIGRRSDSNTAYISFAADIDMNLITTYYKFEGITFPRPSSASSQNSTQVNGNGHCIRNIYACNVPLFKSSSFGYPAIFNLNIENFVARYSYSTNTATCITFPGYMYNCSITGTMDITNNSNNLKLTPIVINNDFYNTSMDLVINSRVPMDTIISTSSKLKHCHINLDVTTPALRSVILQSGLEDVILTGTIRSTKNPVTTNELLGGFSIDGEGKTGQSVIIYENESTSLYQVDRLFCNLKFDMPNLLAITPTTRRYGYWDPSLYATNSKGFSNSVIVNNGNLPFYALDYSSRIKFLTSNLNYPGMKILTESQAKDPSVLVDCGYLLI